MNFCWPFAMLSCSAPTHTYTKHHGTRYSIICGYVDMPVTTKINRFHIGHIGWVYLHVHNIYIYMYIHIKIYVHSIIHMQVYICTSGSNFKCIYKIY